MLGNREDACAALQRGKENAPFLVGYDRATHTPGCGISRARAFPLCARPSNGQDKARARRQSDTVRREFWVWGRGVRRMRVESVEGSRTTRACTAHSFTMRPSRLPLRCLLLFVGLSLSLTLSHSPSLSLSLRFEGRGRGLLQRRDGLRTVEEHLLRGRRSQRKSTPRPGFDVVDMGLTV